MRLAVFRLVFLAAIFVGMNSALAQAPASIPSFMLKKFEGDETVSLDQFSDGVVVLDFFAYWCAVPQSLHGTRGARSGFTPEKTAIRLVSRCRYSR